MLLERDDELSVLGSFVAAAEQGNSGLLVVEGPAGIGKSRLLVEARREAGRAGVRALSARGGELERGLAFGVVRQTVRGRRLRAAEGPAAAAREVFDGSAAGVGAEDASFAILHAPYRLTAGLASRCRCCSSSTTSNGPTSRRCAGCATWSDGSTGSGSRSCAACVRSSGTRTRTGSAR